MIGRTLARRVGGIQTHAHREIRRRDETGAEWPGKLDGIMITLLTVYNPDAAQYQSGEVWLRPYSAYSR